MEEFLSSSGNFQERVTSGTSGFSIFKTFAPSSAKNVPTDGPANTVEQSIIVKDSNMSHQLFATQKGESTEQK